jgi:transcriptional regulator with PAS, ATPase and Fis domain
LTEINKLINELDQAKQIIRNLEAKYTFDDIKGSHQLIVNTIEKARLAASTPATVILRGESGTGKELFAHAIHNASKRKYSQFIRVNCAAISENLLESELFGYEEGSFTGALKGGKMGLFERADGGTIFLDEIGEIPISMQVKLLRVLQEKEVLRVGGSKSIPVDVRVISATNVDLEKAIENASFRQDLYYRLNVFPIRIPPLRDHKDDLDELIMHLINKFNQEYGRSVTDISSMAMTVIKNYDWPGNIRELENFIGRAIINMKINEKIIMIEHLPKLDSLIGDYNEKPLEEVAFTDESLHMNLAEVTEKAEREYIIKVLRKHDYLREDSANALGISVRNLYYKIKKYKIKL